MLACLIVGHFFTSEVIQRWEYANNQLTIQNSIYNKTQDWWGQNWISHTESMYKNQHIISPNAI